MPTKLSLCLLLGLVGCATTPADVPEDLGPFTNGVSTLTGSSKPGYVDGPRGTARFSNPVNVIYGPGNKLYVADFDNDKLRVVDAETGDTGTIINKKGFSRPFGLAWAPDGTLYVQTDNGPNGEHALTSGTIWSVDVNAKTATVVKTNLGRPRGLAVMGDGRIAMADYMHHTVSILDPRTGVVTPLAGMNDAKGHADGAGAAARFAQPYFIVVKDGKLIVSEYENNDLRVVTLQGEVTPFAGVGTAGFADGAMGTSQFNKPQALVSASNGDMFLTDLGNFRVRRIKGGVVDSVAGDGMDGHYDNDDPQMAELSGLEGMSLKPDGSVLYLADGTRGITAPHHYIRIVKL